MASFDFDQISQVEQTSTSNKINFLKLQDDGWYAKVRFMYGPGETIQGQTVHNVSSDPRKPRWVPCLREINQPLDACPLCKNGSKLNVQFFVPVYVISIVSNVRGVTQEEPVGQVMLFQKGTTFKSAIGTVLRQTAASGKPIVSSVFNLVRNGKADDQKTIYTVELVGTDNTTLEDLPPRVQVKGSYILPDVTAQEMEEKYVNGVNRPNVTTTSNQYVPQQTYQNNSMPQGVQPRTLNMNSFAGNTVVGNPTVQPPVQQAPNQAPVINTGEVPF